MRKIAQIFVAFLEKLNFKDVNQFHYFRRVVSRMEACYFELISIDKTTQGVFGRKYYAAVGTRDANAPAIFIPRGFEESGIAFFHSSGIRGSRAYASGSSGNFRGIKFPKMSQP